MVVLKEESSVERVEKSFADSHNVISLNLFLYFILKRLKRLGSKIAHVFNH